jgi:hypothetical protein
LEPEEAVNQALDVLASGLVLHEAHAHDSHIALSVSGLAEQIVIEALGLYLVGLVAGVVRTNLKLSAALLDRTPEGRAQLAAEVEARLTPPAGASPWAREHFVADVRDPWIAEGIGHAILAVRNRAETLCLSGAVVAITVPHGKPSQQGLDLFAIYDDDGLPAIALGEAKATRENGSARLTEAIAFFREVEAGDRDVDIRMQVVLLREALDESLQLGLSGSFWRQRASYLPLIAHGDDVDMSAPRPALLAIPRPATQKRVIHCRPANYARFFEAVATAMRQAVPTINP